MIINPNNSVLFEVKLTQQWPLLACLIQCCGETLQFDDSSVVASAVTVAVVLAEMDSAAEEATDEGFAVDSICSGDEI